MKKKFSLTEIMNHEEVDLGTPPDFNLELQDERDDFSSSGDFIISNYISIESSPDFKHDFQDHDDFQDDFSSSGDREIESLPNQDDINLNTNESIGQRFQKMSENERDHLLENADAANTKRSTKCHIKIFKGKKPIQYI